MAERYKILLGYDGSPCARTALEDIAIAGLPDEIEAVVLTVADVWESPESFADLPSTAGKPERGDFDVVHRKIADSVGQARKIADEGAALLKSIRPHWNINAEACSGKPPYEIVEKSDRWPADLIVVGSQGRSALGRAILGSVSQKVLHEARSSVRIARPRNSPAGGPPRVLIAVDGSEYAEKAVRAVAARRWPPATEFRIITADDDPFSRPEVSLIDALPDGKKDSPAAVEWIKRVVETPSEILRSAGLAGKQLIRWGEARRIILEEAREWPADSIFMGARGLGRFRRFLLGSVSSAVAARAHCSVEIVRAGESDSTG